MTGPYAKSGLRAVIFDVDGTLVDSVDLHAASWRDALARFGKDVPHAEVRAQIGKGGDQLLPVFLAPGELESFGDALKDAHAEIYRARYRPRVRALPGARELVLRVRDTGLKVVLASSGEEEDVAWNTRVLGLEGALDGETTADDAERSKPHPDIFEAALARAGVSAGEAIAVGDSPWDAEAARRAGMPTVGVLSGGFPEADLRGAGCVAIYDGPEDLLARLDGSPLRRG